MKFTIKLFLVIVIAASTIFAAGDMNNGGFSPDGDMNNGGRTCTVDYPSPTPSPENANGTDAQTTDANSDDESVLTVIENYLRSLIG